MPGKNIQYNAPEIEAFYREHRTHWDDFYLSERVVFERLHLDAASAVLDIGCGCGGLGLALRERFGVLHYTGVEINGTASQTARKMNPRGVFINADILAVSPLELLREQSFDLVVSLSCIDWNREFHEMLDRAYRYVKPGGYLVLSLRLTTGESLADGVRSYQYINFEGKREGEIAPYVILNAGDCLRTLRALSPAKIIGFGYWGTPSATAVTPVSRVGFAVMAVQRPTQPGVAPLIDLDLPRELFEPGG